MLDSAGGVLVQKRMDGCPDGAYMKFSYAKARTCIHLQTSSRVFREKYTGSGEAPKFTQAAAMVTLMKDELVPVAGGVLIKAEGTMTNCLDPMLVVSKSHNVFHIFSMDPMIIVSKSHNVVQIFFIRWIGGRSYWC